MARFVNTLGVEKCLLGEKSRDADKKKVERVTIAFLKMRKLDIGELENAYKG